METAFIVQGIELTVVRKDVRHVRISVHPPDGRVRVSAPRHLTDAAIRRMLAPKLHWIRRKQAEVLQRDQQPRLELVTGERHLHFGQRYRLLVVEDAGRPGVSLVGDTMELRVPPGASVEKRAAVLERWYRAQLAESARQLLGEWERRLGVVASAVRIRRMRTRWGSCNTMARRIWVNLELAKRPHICLEYVLVHELVHLLEPSHGRRFWSLMDEFMPQWRQHRDALRSSSGRASRIDGDA
ncbi:MAG: M48 family metallopeptidase [Coriobacteriia bacterium]